MRQRRTNVNAPLTAWLTDAMVLPAGEAVPLDPLIRPRTEPEMVFVLGRDLRGPGVDAATAITAVEQGLAGMEIIDSRYRDFRFTLPDVVAANGSSGCFVTGPIARSSEAFGLSVEACTLQVDDTVVDRATGAAVQGRRPEALALAANVLGRRGHTLRQDWIVLTDGMTDAFAGGPGAAVTAAFDTLGRVTVEG